MSGVARGQASAGKKKPSGSAHQRNGSRGSGGSGRKAGGKGSIGRNGGKGSAGKRGAGGSSGSGRGKGSIGRKAGAPAEYGAPTSRPLMAAPGASANNAPATIMPPSSNSGSGHKGTGSVPRRKESPGRNGSLHKGTGSVPRRKESPGRNGPALGGTLGSSGHRVAKGPELGNTLGSSHRRRDSPGRGNSPGRTVALGNTLGSNGKRRESPGRGGIGNTLGSSGGRARPFSMKPQEPVFKQDGIDENDLIKYEARRFWLNHGKNFSWFALWWAVQAALWFNAVFKFQRQPYTKVYNALGYSLLASRASAAVIRLNMALLLVMVSRRTISTFESFHRINAFFPFDKTINFHKKLGWNIGFMTMVHTVGHYFNFLKLANLSGEEIAGVFPDFTPDCVDPATQPAKDCGFYSEYDLAFKTLAGITGHVAFGAYILLVAAAYRTMRTKHFQLFFWTHRLGYIFYGCILSHGFGYLLATPPAAWKWVIGPMILLVLDFQYRTLRTKDGSQIKKVIKHDDSVIEVQFERKWNFEYKPGQYITICFPSLNSQWHPFTLTSAPEDALLSLHIRRAGDWTSAFQDILTSQLLTSTKDGKVPSLLVDGPYGAPADTVFRYQTAVLIGGGIGVTPFASILKSIYARLRARRRGDRVWLNLREVYFIWISRDQKAFGWFSDVLSELEKTSERATDFDLYISMYLTRAPQEVVEKVKGRAKTMRKNEITGIRAEANIGRPDWRAVFEELEQRHYKQLVGVFLCGAKPLSKEVSKWAGQYSKPGGTRFVFKRENF